MTAPGTQSTATAEMSSNGMSSTPQIYANDWDIPCNETSDADKLCRQPVVSVIVFTYNHEKYIAKAIESMVMQKTDFEYEILLTEDCSQDRTREICFEYQKRFPDRIRVLWAARNLNGFNFRRVRIRCRGKYIAYCDGDDYWTDPKKLQKQVEYMESHPGCAGCFHERVTCDKDGVVNEWAKLPNEMKHALTGDEIAAWTFPCPPTCTVMYRREVLATRPERLNHWVGGDRANALWAAYFHGTVDWLEGVAPSVYRIHSGGVSQGLDELHLTLQDHAVCRQTLKSFPVSRQTRRTIHGKMEAQTFRAWWKWHASESEEERRAVRDLLRNNVVAWPALRWRLWGRQASYWLNQECWRIGHGLVMGIKRVLPTGMYEQGRRLLQKRHSGGRA